MQYAFQIAGANKAELLEALIEEFDAVLAANPDFAATRDEAYRGASGYIDLLDELDGVGRLSVSVNGAANYHENGRLQMAALSIAVAVINPLMGGA